MLWGKEKVLPKHRKQDRTVEGVFLIHVSREVADQSSYYAGHEDLEFVREAFTGAFQASKRSYRDIHKSYRDIRSDIRSDKPEECECHRREHAANMEPSCTCSFAAFLSSLHRGRSGEDGDDGNASRGSESRAVTGLGRSREASRMQRNSTTEHKICLFDDETAAENVR